GGSSIALALTASSGANFAGTVTLMADQAQIGGTGGAGLKALLGGLGSPGIPCSFIPCGNCYYLNLFLGTFTQSGTDGKKGGKGGDGGSSGPGGGGSNGSSIAFLTDELTGTLAGSGSIVQMAGGLAEDTALGNCGPAYAGQTTPAACPPETIGHAGILGNLLQPAVLPTVASCVP
ncbi:MAG: hypothetical protein ACI9OJ_005114, partial [Myxococcota bacterium]